MKLRAKYNGPSMVNNNSSHYIVECRSFLFWNSVGDFIASTPREAMEQAKEYIDNLERQDMWHYAEL